MKKSALSAFLAVALVLCGSSVSAQVRSVRAITVTNCLNGAELLSNVAVTAAGERTEVTSFLGEARINVARDTPITFEAQGFETYYDVAGDDTRFCLAPDLDDQFVLELFHRLVPTELVILLGHPGKGPSKEVFVIPADEYKTGVARANIEKGFALLTEATANLQVFTVVDKVPLGAIDPVVINVVTAYTSLYATYRRTYGSDGFSIEGCNILLPEFAHAVERSDSYSVFAHEGGHCFGMGHAGEGMMSDPHVSSAFSDAEKMKMRIALIRGQGHKFVDRDKRLP